MFARFPFLECSAHRACEGNLGLYGTNPAQGVIQSHHVLSPFASTLSDPASPHLPYDLHQLWVEEIK